MFNNEQQSDGTIKVTYRYWLTLSAPMMCCHLQEYIKVRIENLYYSQQQHKVYY